MSYFLMTFMRNGNTYSTVCISRTDGPACIVEAIRQLSREHKSPAVPLLWLEITEDQAKDYKVLDEEIGRIKKTIEI